MSKVLYKYTSIYEVEIMYPIWLLFFLPIALPQSPQATLLETSRHSSLVVVRPEKDFRQEENFSFSSCTSSKVWLLYSTDESKEKKKKIPLSRIFTPKKEEFFIGHIPSTLHIDSRQFTILHECMFGESKVLKTSGISFAKKR